MDRERLSEITIRWSYNAAARTLGALRLKDVVRRHVFPRLVGVLQSSGTHGSFSVAERYIEEELERLARADGPIILGPWLSEVGFELLYWIPLLRWFKSTYNVDPKRLVVVSRGGTRLWYGDLAGTYLDLLDWMAPAEFALANQARWKSDLRQKQFVPLAEDEEIIAWTRAQLPSAKSYVLHPSLMYRLFAPVFQDHVPFTTLLSHVRYERLPKPVLPGLLADVLPPEYVAMRFYFRPSFPDCAENRSFVGDLISRIAKVMPVVLLNTGLELDDHIDCTDDSVVSLKPYLTPATNLDVQTRVIANSRGFIGTYGGLCYLAPFFGTNSIGFYSNKAGLNPVHLRAMHSASESLEGRLMVLHTGDLEFLDLLGLGADKIASRKQSSSIA